MIYCITIIIYINNIYRRPVMYNIELFRTAITRVQQFYDTLHTSPTEIHSHTHWERERERKKVNE